MPVKPPGRWRWPRNDYGKEAYNRRFGGASRIDPEEGEFHVHFDGNAITDGFRRAVAVVLPTHPQEGCLRTPRRRDFRSALNTTSCCSGIGLHRSDPAHPPGDARRESGRRGRSPSKPAGRGDTVICASVLPKRQLRQKARPQRSLAKRAAALRSRRWSLIEPTLKNTLAQGDSSGSTSKGSPVRRKGTIFPCWRCWTPCGRSRQTASGG